MDVAIIEVSGILATTTWTRAIPSGIIGARILFRYTDPEWDNLVKNVIIRHGGTTRMIIDATNVVELPKELVEVPSAQPVWVGVYGVSPDGSTAIPTLWAPIGIVRNAADPSRDPTSDSGLPIWAQLLLRIEALEKSKDTEVDLNDFVRSVNGVSPDENGNVVVSGGGLNATASGLLIKILRGGVYSEDQSDNITALATELGVTEEDSGDNGGSEDSGDSGETEVTLTSISATYSGGDVAVGTAVTALTGIVVTAHYSDGTSEAVTGYTLSGTIAEGENTVTVSYEGKTATFTVTGVAESGGGDGTAVNLYERDGEYLE